MRVVICLLAALAMSAGAAIAQEHIEYPWCANYSGGADGGGGSNCGFTSYAQCKETVSGIGGFCDPNPFYKGPTPRQDQQLPPRKRNSR